MSAGSAHRRGWRWIRIAAWVVVGILCAYPIAANLLLSLGGVQKMFEGTDQVKVNFRRAWSFWPGHVHVEGVRLTMQDRNVEFSLELAHADIDIRLIELAHQTLHATKVRGDGVVCRFRHRIEPESADAPFVSALPPIFEFEDPPLRLSDAPEAPLDEAHYNLWTVHMDDVDVHLTELWAQMFRYQGEGRVRGAFRLRPAKKLWVGPAELSLMGGKLSTGPRQVLHDMEGSLNVKVDDFDTEPVHGLGPFKFIFARLQLKGQVPDLEGVNFLAGPSASFHLQDGSGAVDLDLAVDHGSVTSESRFSYATDHLGLATSSIKAHVDGNLVVSANRPPGKPGGQLAVLLGRGSLGLDRSVHPPLQLRGLEASVATTHVDIMRAWELAGEQARVEQATLPELAWLNDLPLAKKTWVVERGRGRASGAVTISPDDDVLGSIDIAVEEAAGTAGKLKWQGTADAVANLRSSFSKKSGLRGQVHASTHKFKVDINDQGLRVSSLAGDVRFTGQDARGSVEMHDMRASSSGMSSTTPLAKIDATFLFPPDKGTAGELRGTTGTWTADVGSSRFEGSSASANVAFTSDRMVGSVSAADIKASSLGSCPFTELKSAQVAGTLLTPEGAPATAAMRGSLDGLSLRWGEFAAAANRMLFSGSWDGAKIAAKLDSTKIHLKNGVGAPKSWQADATATTIQTTLALAGGVVHGPVRIDVKRIIGQVGSTKIGGDVVASLDVVSKDDSHRIADVTGVIQARNVDLSSRQHTTDDWWAEFKIDSAHLDTRQNFDMAGKVRARFRDGLPALNVLASEDDIPKWVPTLLPLQGIALDLGIERFCKWTDVQILEASGGPLSAKGRFQLEPGETRGAILLRLAAAGFVSVGLDFIEDYSNTSPMVGAEWLEKQMKTMTKAATDKHDVICQPEPPKCP